MVSFCQSPPAAPFRPKHTPTADVIVTFNYHHAQQEHGAVKGTRVHGSVDVLTAGRHSTGHQQDTIWVDFACPTNYGGGCGWLKEAMDTPLPIIVNYWKSSFFPYFDLWPTWLKSKNKNIHVELITHVILLLVGQLYSLINHWWLPWSN